MLWLLRREEDRGKLEEWQRMRMLAGNERLLGSLARWLGWVWFSSSLFFRCRWQRSSREEAAAVGAGQADR